MRRLLTCFLAVLLALAGCHGTGRTAFAVKTWDGKTYSGPVALDGGKLTVGRRTLNRDDVEQVIREKAEAASRAAGPTEGFTPLADEELKGLRERAKAAAAKAPGSESVLCLDRGQHILLPDGQQLYQYHALLLVLKEGGRKAADVSLGFDEGRSRRRVLFARAIAPDGTSRRLDPATMKVAVPSDESVFLDPRARVLSGRIPGVEIGSLVEYAHEDELYNPDVPDHFFPGFYFQGDEPVLDSILDVRVPAGRKLNWTTQHMPEAAREPKRSSSDGCDVYRWELHDVEPYTPEPAMPHRTDVAAAVHCSLFFSWDELHKRQGGYQAERIEAPPQVAELAKKIVGDAKTDDEKLAAIYHWVQRNVNYLSIKGSLSSGWAGHAASETLKNGYGDCTDKAIVLASLCKAVGITAYPAGLRTNDSGTAITDIPVPGSNHCINLVLPNGKPRFIDSTATNYRYPYFRSDDHGAKAFIHMKGEILDIPVPPPADNLRESVQDLVLKADGNADAVEKNAYTGTYEAHVRGFWRSVAPRLRGMMMQQYLQRRCPGAACKGFDLGDLDDLSKPLKMTIQYQVPGIATRTADLYIVSPPGFARDFPEVSLPTRKFAIERPTTEEYRTAIHITCPPGFQLVGVPEPLVLHGKHLWYEGSVAPLTDGKTLTVAETFKVLDRTVPVEDYAAYRANATRIAAWSRLKLVFREVKAPGRDTK